MYLWFWQCAFGLWGYRHVCVCISFASQPKTTYHHFFALVKVSHQISFGLPTHPWLSIHDCTSTYIKHMNKHTQRTEHTSEDTFISMYTFLKLMGSVHFFVLSKETYWIALYTISQDGHGLHLCKNPDRSLYRYTSMTVCILFYTRIHLYIHTWDNILHVHRYTQF